MFCNLNLSSRAFSPPFEVIIQNINTSLHLEASKMLRLRVKRSRIKKNYNETVFYCNWDDQGSVASLVIMK